MTREKSTRFHFSLSILFGSFYRSSGSSGSGRRSVCKHIPTPLFKSRFTPPPPSFLFTWHRSLAASKSLLLLPSSFVSHFSIDDNNNITLGTARNAMEHASSSSPFRNSFARNVKLALHHTNSRKTNPEMRTTQTQKKKNPSASSSILQEWEQKFILSPPPTPTMPPHFGPCLVAAAARRRRGCRECF